jgi:hypothetical protein
MMATNPKLPDFPDMPPRRPADEHGKVSMIRQNRFPWPLIGLVTGAALLIAIIAVLPRAPRPTNQPAGAQIPRQPTGRQIQLTNVRLATSPVGNAAYIDAVLHNQGNTDVTGVQVRATFLGPDGQITGTEVAAVSAEAGEGTTTQDLTKEPIKPNDYRAVRMYFEHTPAAWNHQVPELMVAAVTGTAP